MTSRPNPFATRFDLIQPLIDFGKSSQEGLDPAIQELVKIRASQINGCGKCLQMHVSDARRNGETEERIYMLDAWRESSLYSDSERAVLAWTEALTRVEQTGAPDEAYEALKSHFSEEEQIKITLLIAAINAFNRVNIGLRVRSVVPGGRKAA
ncbi:carboxymuconolactone decarboxylase family protein [Rhodoligotrophos defluvii]|uniref:carboxymuconolactone decarboxylase family protein n=1 Tax=Rhodoligotrophos defluvii TaxID=2561934 RepID=UPI0010C9BFBA|nr:carboxymuconolactone decarboxylase family protein [Rhodoligotrophos defluvii]